jgi:hypothetical protein
LKKRVVLLDNVKSLKFSWAELESLITCPEVSGKRLFVGEGTRPNNLTWILTLNGPSMSEDMAQRCVFISIDRPVHSGGWEEETYRYIDDNREALVADALGFFRRTPAPLERHSRWSTWERDVLARLAEPAETQALILERQGRFNVEEEEHAIVEVYFDRRLTGLNYNTAMQVIRIPNETVTEWFNAATNERQRTTAVSRTLRQAHTEGKIHRLKPDGCRSFGRGFLWVGESSPADAVACNDLQERIAGGGNPRWDIDI